MLSGTVAVTHFFQALNLPCSDTVLANSSLYNSPATAERPRDACSSAAILRVEV